MVKCEVTLDREERSFKTLNIIGLNRVTKSVPEVRIHLPPPTGGMQNALYLDRSLLSAGKPAALCVSELI